MHWYAAPTPSRNVLISVVVVRRAEQRSALRVAGHRLARLLEQLVPDEAAPRPSAPPASPAAGWIQMFSNGPSRSIRPFATQLSATPPARHRFFKPVSLAHVARRAEHDLLGHASGSRRRCPCRAASIGSSGSRGGPPNRSWNFAERHRQALAVVEVRHVHPEGAVLLEVDQLASRIRSTIAWVSP